MTAFLAGLKVAGERLHELCDRYGAETVAGVMGQSIDASETALRDDPAQPARTALRAHRPTSTVPRAPGSPDSELLAINCKMTKADDRLIFDYNDSDPHSAGYGMATRAGTVGAVATLMLCLFGSEVPWNHGLMRPVEVVAEDGRCVTAISPMPVSGGAAGANWVAMNAAAGCISKMVSFSERYAGLAFGPGDGSWQLAQFGGLNQYGEPFAAMYLDSLLWGGPAFSDRDGVDSGGAMVILGGGTQDVEQQEVGQPLLYLWRREVPNSGGAGRHRGGNGIEFAMTPIDTDEVSGVMATHGTKLPNRTGIFGGLPGSCARFEIVRGSDALGDLGRGRTIERLDAVDGDYEELPGVNSGLIIKPGEIFNVRLQNGGGYGDPILREPAAVAADLGTGAVSEDVATQIYGVVLNDGEVDGEATAARREEIRAARRAAMTPPGGAGGLPMAISAERWGESLRFTPGADGGAVAVCAHCEEPLGVVAADWRALTGTVALQAADLGPLVQLPEGLVARQYVCPSCVTALWVEVIPEAGDAWQDFELD